MSKKSRQKALERSAELLNKQRIAENTCNWKDLSKPVFVPRLATEAEYPNPQEREYVNSVASGMPADTLTREIVKTPARFFELTKDGIIRWHTGGKER